MAEEPEEQEAVEGEPEPLAPEEDSEAVEEAEKPEEPSEEPAESAEPAPAEGAEPHADVEEKDKGTIEFDLADEEIVKATAGSHGRIGQSAFGIDFGFLEEYEAEYEHALDEFRRLRNKVD